MSESYYKNKSVLITGAGKRGRVGAQIAEHFGRVGAHVIIHFRTGEAEAREVESLIKSVAPDAHVSLISGDLSKPEDVTRIFTNFKPDIVINNAAVFEASKVTDGMSLFDKLKAHNDTLTKNLDANVRSIELVSRAAIDMLQRTKKSGVIVMIGDAFIDRGGTYSEDLTAYTASKSHIPAVVAMLGRAYGKDGIRVLGVLNGTIEPPPKAPEDTVRHMQDEVALPKEMLTPWIGGRAVAQAIDNLIQTEAANGVTLRLDGARSWTTKKEV